MFNQHSLANTPILTHREIEILEYVTQGLSAKEVARCIDISPRTVDRHIENVRLKLHAKNRTHMVVRAVKAGLLSLRGK